MKKFTIFTLAAATCLLIALLSTNAIHFFFTVLLFVVQVWQSIDFQKYVDKNFLMTGPVEPPN